MLNGQVTRLVGNYYEKKGSQVTRYYYAGAQRIAVRRTCSATTHSLRSGQVWSPPAWLPPRAAHGALARCTLREGEVHYR